MSTGLGALRDENVRARCSCLFCKSKGLDLADDQRIRALDPLDEGLGITEGKHDCCRLVLQRELEQLGPLCHAPGNETDAKPRLGICEQIELPSEPWFVAVPAT